MVGAYSGIFGEYPFDKYGMTAIVPFEYGGMEHQTITTLNRHLFTYERLVAHELAHQWWGDLVTCGTWPDVWLNESFATYSEALWQESKGGKAALRDYMKDSLEHFNFLSWTGAVYDPVSQGFNLLDDVVYSKGAWVLHSLRGVIGDSAFFQTLRTYRSMYEQKNATTEEFLAVLDTVTNVRMRWFFDQWVYGRGWPQYALRFGWRQDTLSLTIYQQQDVSCPTYLMPLHVRAFHGTDSTTFVVWDSLRIQRFSIPLSAAPDKVVLDPDDWVLKQIVDAPNGVAGDKLPETFVLDQNYPNPFNPLTHIGYRIPLSGWVSLRVFDLLGREVATLTDEKSGPGEYTVPFDGQNLPSGVYVYQLRVGDRTVSRRMVLMK